MQESTFFILGGLGVLAWLLAGGWPYARDWYVADDGPVGMGAGITAVCPSCVQGGAATIDGDVAARLAASPSGRPRAEVGSDPGGRSLRPVAVGRDELLRLECPTCGTTFAVLGTPSLVVPAPRVAAD